MVFTEICVLDILVQDFQRPFFGLDDLKAGPLTKLDFLVRLRYSKHKYHTFPFEEAV
jgi:hypothetical protein